jgi:flagellar hook-basal body complex protein FliE
MDAIRFSQITLPDLAESTTKAGGGTSGFGDQLKQGLDKMGGLQAEAETQTRKLIAGESVELHRVVMAGEQAALEFELTMSIRNKAVEAFQKVMRMQV